MSDATPSWVTPPSAGPARPRRPASERPPLPVSRLVALAAALLTMTALAAGQAVHVARRDDLVVGLRVFLVAVVAFQVVLAVGLTRRSPGAALGLLACQLMTALASLGGGFGDQRLVFVAGSVLVFALVAVSLSAFPSVALPPIDPRELVMADTDDTDVKAKPPRVPLTPRDKARRFAIVTFVLACLGLIYWGGSHVVEVDHDGEVLVNGVDPSSVTISGDPGLVAEQPPGATNHGPSEAEVVEETIPAQGSETLRQAQIGIDLGDLYDVETLAVNGTVIPDAELTRRPELNQVFFQPADDETFETLPEGHVCATATVERITDPGTIVRSVEWCFEVT